MSLILLGRLSTAKYKGFKFLVSNSSITFGQKTVTHQYPNAKKTEVEFLEIAEDLFELEIYIHGSGYLEKRKRLKDLLSEPKEGLLIHPYQGQVTCSVTSVRLVEQDLELGIGRFSVVFQQSSNQQYPTISSNSKPFILRKLDDLLGAVESGFNYLTNNNAVNAIFTATKLNDVVDTFDNAIDLTYKIADKTNQINEDIIDFKNQINAYAQAPALLGLAIKNLFNTLNFISTDNREQTRILKQFFTFDSDDKDIPETTLGRTERKEVRDAINNSMLANSLALSYATASAIAFTDNLDLETVKNDIEDQYEVIKEQLPNDILSALDDLRSDTLTYLDSLDLAQVSTIDVKQTSILQLAYSNYGDITKYDTLFKLNKPVNPAFIVGEVKVVNE